MNLGSLTCANMSRARPLARVQFRGWFQPPRRATSTTLRFSKRLSSIAETDYSRQYSIILYILSVFVEFRLFQPCSASSITALIESMNRARDSCSSSLFISPIEQQRDYATFTRRKVLNDLLSSMQYTMHSIIHFSRRTSRPD